MDTARFLNRLLLKLKKLCERLAGVEFCLTVRRVYLCDVFFIPSPLSLRGPPRTDRHETLVHVKLYRVASNVGITPLTDHHGWTSTLSRFYLRCEFLGGLLLAHFAVKTFSLDFGRPQAKFHFLQKSQKTESPGTFFLSAVGY